VLPGQSFNVLRALLALAGVSVLLFGLVWDGEEER
jgi:hypothetical protein